MDPNPWAEVIDYDRLPERLRGGMRRYVEDGIPPGDFLQACLANDLVEAIGRADTKEGFYVHAVVMFLYNELPSRSSPISIWGSREAIGRHIMAKLEAREEAK